MNNSFQAGRARSIRWYHSGLVLFLRYLFFVTGLISLLILLGSLIFPVGHLILAVCVFLLSPMLLLESIGLFINYLANHPEFMLDKGFVGNVFNRLDFTSQNVLAAWRPSDGLRGLLVAFNKVKETQSVLLRLGLVDESFAELTNQNFDEKNLSSLLQAAAQPDQEIISVYQFLAAVLRQPALQPLADEHQLDGQTINDVLNYYANFQRRRALARAFWLNDQGRTGGIGKGWAVSYTSILDQLTRTVPSSVRQRVLAWPLFSREKLIDQMVLELNKAAGQNLLLVGEPGSGKRELFFHFAKRVLFYQTNSPLDGQEPRLLNVQRLLAEASTPAQLQQLVDAVFSELGRSDNIILFIDPLAALVSGGDKIGQADLSNILQSHLGNGRVRLIGSLTKEQYLKLVKPNQLLAERFSVIELPEPAESDLLPILLSHLNQFENRYQVFFMVEALTELVKLAERYVKDQASPARELTLLEQIAATNHAGGKIIITADDVRSAVAKKAEVPLQVGAAEQSTLLNLEATLHQRVIGQNRAIKQVSDALLRARAGLSTGQRPIGTFLFLGPTGVGKTETAKALAAIYFGSEKKLIRLDMTEYAEAQGLEKLLGVDAVNAPGALTLAIQDNPSATVLFDEFEKASQPVKNVLLQLLDEGRLTTNYGKVLDFTNAIVIATSNAGSDYIKDQIVAGTPIEQFEKPLVDKLISDRIFSPELVNRFDGVVVFAPLNQAEIEQVVSLQLKLLQSRLKKDKGIELAVAPAVLGELAARGYDPVFGARALQRVIKNDLETAIAKQIIAENPKPGSRLTVSSL